MLFETRGLRVFIYQEAIDMRCGFERLTYFVREKMKGSINQGHVYLFFGKNRRRLKVIFYDGSGLVLVNKKMERGRFMAHVELEDIREITVSDFKLIMHGSVVRRPVLERSILTEKTLLPHSKNLLFSNGRDNGTDTTAERP
jgi:transposase